MPSEAGFALIWAQAQDGVIGQDGQMPWHLPEDLAHFRELTGGDAVVMGRRTWQSLPERFRPLPGRRNIVVTRNLEWGAAGAEVVNSLAQAQSLVGASPLWIIGGGELYGAAIERATRLEVTELDLAVDGDTSAPPIDRTWLLSADTDWMTSRTGIRYRFRSYIRP
ncbi:MAG: dihydrofolate reductase [Microbacteriaceae bacterium]